jgi:hypothetical protein
MSTDADLAGRVAELEERARRFVLATTGSEGWQNYFQSLLMDERQYLLDLMTEVIAQLQRGIWDETKAMLDQVLATRVRGTYQASASYARGDVVALDGGSFLARRDDPGKCPGDGWQLMARQGQRGVAGERGERGPPGKDAPRIDRWIVDRAALTVTPVYSDGIFGPALELRALFAPEDNAAR